MGRPAAGPPAELDGPFSSLASEPSTRPQILCGLGDSFLARSRVQERPEKVEKCGVDAEAHPPSADICLLHTVTACAHNPRRRQPRGYPAPGLTTRAGMARQAPAFTAAAVAAATRHRCEHGDLLGRQHGPAPPLPYPDPSRHVYFTNVSPRGSVPARPRPASVWRRQTTAFRIRRRGASAPST